MSLGDSNTSKLRAMLAAIAAIQSGMFERSRDADEVDLMPGRREACARSRGRGIGHARPAGSKLARMAAEGRCAKGQPR